MLKFILRKMAYGLLVLLGVIALVFFLFQGFGDPSRIVMGQTGDSTTQANIRKDLYLMNEKGETIQMCIRDRTEHCASSKVLIILS